MSEEQIEKIILKIQEVEQEIGALPGSTANGQLIDAASHAKCIREHLKRYMQLKGITRGKPLI